MESTMEKITDMECERVEQGTDKEIETAEQSQENVKETEAKNPGETIGETTVKEHKDSRCPMVIEDGTSLASCEVTHTLDKKTNNDDLPKIDDELNSQLETIPRQSPPPSVALEPEEGLLNPTVEETVESNIGSSEISSNILKNDEDAVKGEKDTEVIHEEITNIPDTDLSKEDAELLHHHADVVMEQENATEEHDMRASGDHKELSVCSVTNVVEENSDKLPVCLDTKAVKESNDALLVCPDTKVVEENNDELLVCPDTKVVEENNDELLFCPDTKVDEENNDRIGGGEDNNKKFAEQGSGPVDHDQGNTMELDKGLEVPDSETISELEDKPSEPLTETSMNVEKEPDVPATENLIDNDKISDVLATDIPVDSERELSVLPATQTSSDRDERVTTLETTLEAEPTEDMKLDFSDSKLVADAIVDSTNNKDVNVEAAINAEKEDNSTPPEVDNADNEGAAVRGEPVPPCVASSNVKSEARGSGELNNGVHKIDLPPPAFDGTLNTKPCFLLDDMSEGNESGTEEDQSAFMKELERFFRERNMDFKPPKFYGEGLNCLKLWRAVTRLGGYDKVTGSKLWRQVGESFRPPKTCTTVSWTFRGFYEKALLEYERHKVSGGELQIPLASELEPMNIDNQASGSGRARRDAAQRAMQGWHSQRLNCNGEVSDPATKDKSLVVHQKREKQSGITPGLLKRKRPAEVGAKNAIQVSKPMLDVTVVDVGPPADWVKINVQRTQDCFEVYALVPGLVREEVRVQSDPAGRLVISGEPENPMNPWGATPFKKVVSLPTRIDPHHTSAVVTLNGQLFVRVPLEQLD